MAARATPGSNRSVAGRHCRPPPASKYHELLVRKYKSQPVSDPSEMWIATLTAAGRADVGHTWAKQATMQSPHGDYGFNS
jgi:hypothetical protein